MRKIVCFIAMTLDGYIAEENHNLSFLDAFNDPEIDDFIQNFMKGIDTLIMGHQTYLIIKDSNPWPYPNHQSYVITHQDYTSKDHIVFTSNYESLVKDLKQQPGHDIWLMGGGKLIHAFLKSNLMDELQISILPILLGKGIPLFQHQDHHILFKHIETKHVKDIVHVIYQKK